MLEKSFRLPPYASFANAQTSHTRYLLIKIKKNDLNLNRFGFVISKKVIKSAVDRNRLKRRIRAVIEENMDKFALGYDMLLIITKPVAEADTIDKKELIESIIKKIQ